MIEMQVCCGLALLWPLLLEVGFCFITREEDITKDSFVGVLTFPFALQDLLLCRSRGWSDW